MRSGSEDDVKAGLQTVLDRLALGRYDVAFRKSRGQSMIGKPVDLQVQFKTGSQRDLIAVEVANVNTTQLVGETCRLYFDACPAKLLVLGDRNVPRDGQKQCEELLARLYGQAKIDNTPARVVSYSDDIAIENALVRLLLLEAQPVALPVAVSDPI